MSDVVTAPKFKVGDQVTFVPSWNGEELECYVLGTQALGWSSDAGTQGYATNIALTLLMPDGRRRDVWQSFCKPSNYHLDQPLSDDPYNEVMASVEAMEKVSG